MAFPVTAAVVAGLTASYPIEGFDWMVNEVHLQYEELDKPFITGGRKEQTLILTWQHADE